MRTYLIEPQTVFVPYLARTLAAAGLEVIASHHDVDGKDLGARAPAAVFIDVDYFVRGAPTTLCRVREALRHAVVIALSESTDPTFAATCVISGADVLCDKKDGEDGFLRSIRTALSHVQRPATI